LNQPLLEELEIIVERWEKGALFVQEHPEKSKKSFRRKKIYRLSVTRT
jgi:hypothetical protein